MPTRMLWLIRDGRDIHPFCHRDEADPCVRARCSIARPCGARASRPAASWKSIKVHERENKRIVTVDMMRTTQRILSRIDVRSPHQGPAKDN